MNRKSQVSAIKGVILDFGEVLCVKPSGNHIQRLADVFGMSAARFQRLYDKNRLAYDRGDFTPERYWFSFADEPGVSLRADQIPQLRAWDVEMWSTMNPVMISWLEALHSSGMKTALLSNMPGDMIEKVRRDFDWLRHFDHATFSYNEHLVKPEAAIYQRCLKGVGTQAYETLFVDDREVNIQAARALGMHAVLFRSPAQLRRELEMLGVAVVPSDTEDMSCEAAAC